MTPLMWAYPDHKPERFKRLLKHGADPNVIITSDLGTGRASSILGTSVTHLATRSNLLEHFQALYDHGGDPNLVQKSAIGNNDTPLALLIKFGFPDKRKRIQILIDKGVDLNRLVGERTLPMRAVGWGGQYDIALMLLKAGANPKAYKSDEVMKLTHILVREEDRGKSGSPKQQTDYKKLVAWMEKHGESLDEARVDLDRWRARVGSLKEKAAMRRKEIAERKAREIREKKAREKPVVIHKEGVN